MFPSAAQAHSDLLAKMRYRAHRPARIGAVFYVTEAEATERGRPTNEGIFALAQDIQANLVWEDPKIVHARIDELNANEAKYAASGYKPGPDYFAVKKQLEDVAAALDARQSKLTADEAQTQITFSNSFFGFKDKWDVRYAQIKAGDFDSAGNGVLGEIDEFDTQYRSYVTTYQSFGFTPMFVPEKSNAGDTFGKGGSLEFPKLPDIPWGKVALGVGGAALIYWLVTRPRAAPAPMPEPEPLRLRSPTLDEIK